MMVRWKLLALVAVLVAVLSTLAGWIMAYRSDAFAVAEQFIRRNDVLSANVGDVRRVSLAFFGYGIRYSGARGDAAFEIDVEGESGSGTVFIELEKRGVWEVTLARIVRNGTTAIELMKPTS